jgi:hypothetical protein
MVQLKSTLLVQLQKASSELGCKRCHPDGSNAPMGLYWEKCLDNRAAVNHSSVDGVKNKFTQIQRENSWGLTNLGTFASEGNKLPRNDCLRVFNRANTTGACLIGILPPLFKNKNFSLTSSGSGEKSHTVVTQHVTKGATGQHSTCCTVGDSAKGEQIN